MRVLIILVANFFTIVAAANALDTSSSTTSMAMPVAQSGSILPDGITLSLTPEFALSESSIGANSKLLSGSGMGVASEISKGHLGLESGLQIIQYGSVNDSNAPNADLRLNYISLPIALKYYFRGEARNDAFLKLGASASWLASQSGATPNMGVNNFETESAIGLGGKFAIDSKGHSITVELDYVSGLSDAIHEGANIAGVLTVGYRFDL
jgi:hypothetical protein